MRRVRRPLIALVILVLLLVIGYVVQAARSDHHSDHGPAPSISRTSPATP